MKLPSMSQLLRVLQFLRVTDTTDNLSLTNIALVAVLSRLLLTPDLPLADLGAFLAAVIGYHVKRFALPVGAPEDLSQLQTAVAELQTKTTALQLSGQIKRQ